MSLLKTVLRLTGVHVCSVRQRLGLPPVTDSFLLLLLQDESAKVGLDLRVKTVSHYGALVLVHFSFRSQVFKGKGKFFLFFVFLVLHQPFPAPAPAASWPHLSGLQTRPPPPASSSSTRSLQEFRVKSTQSRSTTGPGNVMHFTKLQHVERHTNKQTNKQN